jgi:hypothetical protein
VAILVLMAEAPYSVLYMRLQEEVLVLVGLAVIITTLLAQMERVTDHIAVVLVGVLTLVKLGEVEAGMPDQVVMAGMVVMGRVEAIQTQEQMHLITLEPVGAEAVVLEPKVMVEMVVAVVPDIC